jgi:hypothetical protein
MGRAMGHGLMSPGDNSRRVKIADTGSDLHEWTQHDIWTHPVTRAGLNF